MITSDQIAAFFLFALVAAVTPGPSNMMIVATGSTIGLVRGLPCAFGASVGMGMLLFISTLGLGQLVVAHPMLVGALNWCGAAFLFWLAWKIATAEGSPEMSVAKPVGFLGAAAFQWINPKGWMVAVGAAGTYLQAGNGDVGTQAAAFGGLFFLAAFPSALIWLFLGALMRRMLHDRSNRRAFNILMGLALAVSVAMMLR